MSIDRGNMLLGKKHDGKCPNGKGAEINLFLKISFKYTARTHAYTNE